MSNDDSILGAFFLMQVKCCWSRLVSCGVASFGEKARMGYLLGVLFICTFHMGVCEYCPGLDL